MTDFLDTMAQAGVGTVKGIALGAAAGPIGMAVGGLAGLATSLVPHIFGADAQPALEAAAQAITGSSDEGTQLAVLSTDSAAIAQFKVQALKIAADRENAARQAITDEVAARLADVQDSRKMSTDLAKAGSRLAWGAAVVSFVLLLAWFSSLIANYFGAPALSADDAATLRNLALLVAGYWIGTNRSSDHKTDLLAQSMPANLMLNPTAVMPASDVK